MPDILIGAGITLAIFAALIGGVMWVSSAQCAAAWTDSGHPYRWAPIQGCQIQIDGAWIPSASYRVF